MIVNGAARKDGGQLAQYLQREGKRSNERVQIVDIRGTVSADLRGALCEMDDVATGSRCEKHIYHANINTHPDEYLSAEQWRQCADRLGAELGLGERHQRVIVLHEKRGEGGAYRQHAHVVWNRVDGDTLRATHMGWSYRGHERAARMLEREYAHRVVPGPHIDPDSLEVRSNPLEQRLDRERFATPVNVFPPNPENLSVSTPDQPETEETTTADIGNPITAHNHAPQVAAPTGQEGHMPKDQDQEQSPPPQVTPRDLETAWEESRDDAQAAALSGDRDAFQAASEHAARARARLEAKEHILTSLEVQERDLDRREDLAREEQRRMTPDDLAAYQDYLTANARLAGREPDPERYKLEAAMWSVEVEEERLDLMYREWSVLNIRVSRDGDPETWGGTAADGDWARSGDSLIDENREYLAQERAEAQAALDALDQRRHAAIDAMRGELTVRVAQAFEEQRRVTIEDVAYYQDMLAAQDRLEGRKPDQNRNELLSELWAVETEQQRLARDHAHWIEARDLSAAEAARLNKEGYLIDAAPHDLDAHHARRQVKNVEWEQGQTVAERDDLQRKLEAYDSLTKDPLPAYAPAQPAQEAPERAETDDDRRRRELLEYQAARAEATRRETEERYLRREKELYLQMDAEVQRSVAQQLAYEQRLTAAFEREQEERIIAEIDRLEAVREASLGRLGFIREAVADRLNPQRVEEREQALRKDAEANLADSLEFQKQYFGRQQSERNAKLEPAVRARVAEEMEPQFQALDESRKRDLERADASWQRQNRNEQEFLRDRISLDRYFGINREHEQSAEPSKEQEPSHETEQERQPETEPQHNLSGKFRGPNAADPLQRPRTAAERRAAGRSIRQTFSKAAAPSQSQASPSKSPAVERSNSPDYDLGP